MAIFRPIFQSALRGGKTISIGKTKSLDYLCRHLQQNVVKVKNFQVWVAPDILSEGQMYVPPHAS